MSDWHPTITDDRYYSPEAWALFTWMGRMAWWPPRAAPENRCMGKFCSRNAEFVVSALDPNLALQDHPVRLCREHLCAITPDTSPVDIFRWLSDNRIEADA